MIARRASPRAAPLFFICLSLLATASAQETTLRTRSNLVLVPTLIKDLQGAVVYGLEADVTNVQPGDDGAAILDAVAYSIQLLRNEPEDRQRVLLLISETRDHGSRVKIEDAVAAVGEANTMMYALAFSPGISNILDTARGTNKNEMHPTLDLLDLAYRTAQAMRKNVPSTITSMTGGEYELFTTRKKFEVRMNDFTNHLHSRYLLSFAPKDPSPGLHQLRVRLKDPSKGTVLARTSYWAEDANKEDAIKKDANKN
jgi:hypothetical protein